MERLKSFIYILLLTFLLGGLSILGIFFFFGKGLPDYSKLADYDPPVITRIYAGDGRLFAEYATEKRIFVPIEAIPEKVQLAFIAAEDKSFYDHVGIDFMGILRAATHNIISFVKGSGGLMGGSTITQQVAKNFLLHSKKTFSRKIKEAILTLRIERAFTKQKILELYLNEIYLGRGAYGVASAALQYFNKSLNELTDAEIAFLAALPKAPNNYNPRRFPKAALNRRNWVIVRMLEEGVITREEARAAKHSPIKLERRAIENTVDAAFFAEDVRRFLMKQYGQNVLYEGGLAVHTTLDSRLQQIADESLRQGIIAYDHKHGWHGRLGKIPLTDWPMYLKGFQKPAGIAPWTMAVVLKTTPHFVEVGLENGKTGYIPFETMRWARTHNRTKKGAPYLGPELKHPHDILKPGDVILVQQEAHFYNPTKAEVDIEWPEGTFCTLQQIPLVNGALVALDPNTGRILAMAGGFTYKRSQFNRATQALRQAGSTFKPFTYLAALEEGYSPASLLLDAPFVMDMGKDQGVWAPRNIEKRSFGTNTLRRAIEKSFNLTPVRLAHQIGMDKIQELSKRLGIYENLPPYLATVLGSEETTLLAFTAAYGTFVNGGKKIDPHFIDRIQDRHGKTIFKFDKRVCIACNKNTVAATDSSPPYLPDPRAQLIDPIHAYQMTSMLEGAVERGTAKRSRVDGATLGAKTGTSNDYKDVWTIGFSQDLLVGVYLGFDSPKSMGRYNTGGSVAAPVFKSFMKAALKGKPDQPFRIPPNTQFRHVHKETGKFVSARHKRAFLEAFHPEQLSTQKNLTTGENIMHQALSNDTLGGIY